MLERYYRILGVSPDAALSDVKSAYRKLVRQWHPDRHSHAPHMMKLAEETLKDVNHAYREIVRHLAARTPLGEPRHRSAATRRAPPGRPHKTTAVVEAVVRTVKGLLDLIRSTARDARRADKNKTAQSSGPPSPPRFAAAFEKVLNEVASQQHLGFKNADANENAAKDRSQARRYQRPAAAARQGGGDTGPVAPVDRVGPVHPVRRKR